jgi:hypothetical protein
MAEIVEEDKFINCTKCHCKYHNNDEHIKIDFGYKRLGDRYKLCVKCRDKKKQAYNANKETYQAYYEEHKEEIAEKARQYRLEHPEAVREKQRRWKKKNPEKVKEEHRRYRENHREQINAWQREYRERNIVQCACCRIYLLKNKLKDHLEFKCNVKANLEA